MVSRANPRYDDKVMDAARQILNIGSAVVDVAMLVAEVGREVPIASAVLQAFLVVHDKVEKVNANKDELEALRDRCRYLTAVVVETQGRRPASLNLKPLEDCLRNVAKVVEECGAQKGVVKYLRASKDKDEIERINTRLDRLVNDTGWSGTMKILGLDPLVNEQTLSAQPVKRYDEAEEVLRQSLEIKKVTLGEDDVSGREETKLGTADSRGDSTSARSPSRFGNTANQILLATRVTARAAQSSSIYLVPEVKKTSMIVPSPLQLEPDAQYPAMVHPLRSGDTEIDVGNEFVFSSPRVMESGYLPHTAPQPSTEHPSMNEDRPRALVDGRGSHDTDSVSGREETKLGTADRRGGSASARSPSRFGRALVDGHRSHDIDPVSGREETKLGTADRRGGSASARPPSRFSNAMNQMLCTTRATARAAQSSSISLVPEVAVLVETLVGLAEDSRTNPEVFKKSNELCRWLKVVLEGADQLHGLDTNPSGVSDLLRGVKESVESLVGVMKAYQRAGKVFQVFMASVYCKRHEAAKEAVREMLQYFQISLAVHVARRQAHEQERCRKEVENLRETLTELIGNSDLQSHARRPKVDSMGERRAKLLGNMEIAIEDIEISDNVLGEGVSGKVYFADYRGFNAAAKIMELEGDRNERKQRNAFLNELQHMKRLASAHTIQVFGVVKSAPGKLLLVMELMPGGDLFLYISKKRKENQAIPEKIARRLIGDVAAGMEFLHSSNTWHGDLKSPNVLLDASDRAKISDFGTSHWTEQTKSKSVQSNCRISGTAWFDTLTFRWAAPEVLSASEEQQLTRRQARTTPVAASPRPTTRLSFKSDVYSFAIIAWEILSLKVPWDHLSSREIYLLVCGKQDRPRIPEGAPPDLADLVRQCWDASPERRPTSRQILDRLGRKRR